MEKGDCWSWGGGGNKGEIRTYHQFNYTNLVHRMRLSSCHHQGFAHVKMVVFCCKVQRCHAKLFGNSGISTALTIFQLITHPLSFCLRRGPWTWVAASRFPEGPFRRPSAEACNIPTYNDEMPIRYDDGCDIIIRTQLSRCVPTKKNMILYCYIISYQKMIWIWYISL